MKTNDDNNMMSSTTKNDSPLLKMKMTFSHSRTTPEYKGCQSHGRKRVSHAFKNNTHEITHKKITMKLSWNKKLYPQCLVLVNKVLGTGYSVIYNRIIAFSQSN